MCQFMLCALGNVGIFAVLPFSTGYDAMYDKNDMKVFDAHVQNSNKISCNGKKKCHCWSNKTL